MHGSRRGVAQVLPIRGLRGVVWTTLTAVRSQGGTGGRSGDDVSEDLSEDSDEEESSDDEEAERSDREERAERKAAQAFAEMEAEEVREFEVNGPESDLRDLLDVFYEVQPRTC